jgi:MarR family transcriptional regulator for hemolysin
MQSDPNNIGFAIKGAVRAMERAFDFELRNTARITLSQARVIRALTGSDGMTQKELAESIAVEAPTLVPIIDRMEQEGLLERRQDRDDRRNNRIYLTAKSRSLSNEIDASLERVRKAAYRGIPKQDIETLKQALDSIAKNAAGYLESQEQVEVQKVK